MSEIGIKALLMVFNIFAVFVIIALSVPLVKRQVKPNKTYGVRFKASFQSDEAWYDINEFGGRSMIKWSLLILAITLFTPWLPVVEQEIWALIISLAPLLVLGSAWESWKYAKAWRPKDRS
jgi:hypothetical protein